MDRYGEGAGTGDGAGNFVEGAGAHLERMIETDPLDAAYKKHQLKLQAQKEKVQRRLREKGGELEYKSDQEDPDEGDPEDSEEGAYEDAARAEIDREREPEEGDEEGDSYDSELERDFFGNADPELNAKLER